MDIALLTGWLTEGLAAADAAVVKAAIERDAVKTKAAGLKLDTEYNTLASERAQLLAELDGDQANNKIGTRAYQKWYTDNYKKVEANDKAIAEFEKKYGAGSFALYAAGQSAPPPAVPGVQATAMTPDDIQRAVDKRIQDQYAPRWGNLLVAASTLTTKHIRSGRTTDIDYVALEKIAAEKTGGDLNAAYDIWDAPEREKSAKANADKEVERRVKEELQKRGASSNFPAAADMAPSSLATRSKADVDGFDPVALRNQLAAEWQNPGQAA